MKCVHLGTYRSQLLGPCGCKDDQWAVAWTKGERCHRSQVETAAATAGHSVEELTGETLSYIKYCQDRKPTLHSAHLTKWNHRQHDSLETSHALSLALGTVFITVFVVPDHTGSEELWIAQMCIASIGAIVKTL